ncbi:MAG: hypothetical protein MHM6MM_003040 [Cercozoa sp. M6MM]
MMSLTDLGDFKTDEAENQLGHVRAGVRTGDERPVTPSVLRSVFLTRDAVQTESTSLSSSDKTGGSFRAETNAQVAQLFGTLDELPREDSFAETRFAAPISARKRRPASARKGKLSARKPRSVRRPRKVAEDGSEDDDTASARTAEAAHEAAEFARRRKERRRQRMFEQEAERLRQRTQLAKERQRHERQTLRSRRRARQEAERKRRERRMGADSDDDGSHIRAGAVDLRHCAEMTDSRPVVSLDACTDTYVNDGADMFEVDSLVEAEQDAMSRRVSNVTKSVKAPLAFVPPVRKKPSFTASLDLEGALMLPVHVQQQRLQQYRQLLEKKRHTSPSTGNDNDNDTINSVNNNTNDNSDARESDSDTDKEESAGASLPSASASDSTCNFEKPRQCQRDSLANFVTQISQEEGFEQAASHRNFAHRNHAPQKLQPSVQVGFDEQSLEELTPEKPTSFRTRRQSAQIVFGEPTPKRRRVSMPSAVPSETSAPRRSRRMQVRRAQGLWTPLQCVSRTGGAQSVCSTTLLRWQGELRQVRRTMQQLGWNPTKALSQVLVALEAASVAVDTALEDAKKDGSMSITENSTDTSVPVLLMLTDAPCRTLKYMAVAALGVTPVTAAWLHRCLQSQRWLLPQTDEWTCAAVNRFRGGPFKGEPGRCNEVAEFVLSRLRPLPRHKRLLHGWHVSVCAVSNKAAALGETLQHFAAVLSLAGAVVGDIADVCRSQDASRQAVFLVPANVERQSTIEWAEVQDVLPQYTARWEKRTLPCLEQCALRLDADTCQCASRPLVLPVSELAKLLLFYDSDTDLRLMMRRADLLKRYLRTADSDSESDANSDADSI